MKRNLIYTLIICSAFIQCTESDPIVKEAVYDCGSAVINSHPKSTKFQEFLNKKVKQGIPGITMLIETPKGIWSGAAGLADIPNKISMQPCSINKVGSITKVFTATLILQLYEQGKLSLDDSISKYLSATIVNKVANSKTATIKNLLNHTSGIPDYLSQLDYTIIDYYNNPTKVWTPMEELEYIFREPASFAAGTKIEYSNTNFLLLGMIIENITKLKGEQLYEDYIYAKLNLTNTFLYQDGSNPSNLTRGYFDEFGDGKFIDITSLKRFSNSMVGGISSNTENLNIFLRALFTPNVLLKQQTIEKMITITSLPFLNKDEFIYGTDNKVNRVEGIGLGIFKLNTDYGFGYGHNGGYIGRAARMWYFPDDKKSIVFMINATGTSIKNITREIFRNEMLALLFED